MARPRTVTPIETDLKAALARAARKELAVRRALPSAFAAYDATLQPWQRAVVHSRARRIVLFAGRRSGKTYALGACILAAAVAHPGSTIPVFERTTTCQGAVVLWKYLQEANERFNLGMTFHHSLLRATLPNRTEVIIIGADTVEAADKARGNAYPVAFVDEAGTFRPHILDYLIHDVLDAALLDYQGQLIMAGTPPPRWATDHPFYVAAHSDEWQHAHATFLDNDALPLDTGTRKWSDESPEVRRAAREAEFADMLARNHWTAASPRVQREWLGVWLQDTESLLYRVAPSNYAGVAAPDTSTGGWRFGLSVDFGYDDPCAFVVFGWRPRVDGRVWVLESYQAEHLIPASVAVHIERLRLRYRFGFIVGDTGGAGKPYTEELRQRYGIPIEAAQKRGKEAYIELLNGDLASGALQLVERTNQDLISDLYTVRKDPMTGLDDDADHDASHLPDALRYGITRIHAGGGLGDADGPEPGTAAWHQAQEAELERRMVAAHRRQHQPPDALAGHALDDVVGMLGD